MAGPSEAPRDPELARLLIQELEKHLVTLVAHAGVDDDVRRALHALKGSAALAGERDLSAALTRLHRRLKEGDPTALGETRQVVKDAIARLRAGESAVAARWPTPPDDLHALPLDPLVRAQYTVEVTDRLARIDDALAKVSDPVEAARDVYRHVHTLKGAASAVGDDPMTWFCHGLEEALKATLTPEAATAALETMSGWRVVLSGLLDDPDTALTTLRARGRPSQAPRGSVRPRAASAHRPPTEPPPRASVIEDASTTIRVSALDVDRLLERFDAIDLASEYLGARAERARENALTVRRFQASLAEVLRIMGPSRPWGVPHAVIRRVEDVIDGLSSLGEDLDGASGRLLATDHRLRHGVAEAKRQLSSMRQTAMGGVFARLAAAIESEARRSGRAVVVRTRGADLSIDRRLAEQLVEPCLQLARNAVAHGIEPPEVRVALQKPPTGTVSLAARKFGDRLSISIEDDGSGVDVRHVRERALAADLITPAIADAADDDTFLSLLFVPGFSTRDSTDLLAGRGIGLEIARSVTQRLGGVIRISSRAGEGFSARIDVPIESGLVRVLWVRAGDGEFALPAASAKQVLVANASAPPPHLLECLDAPAPAHPSHIVELELEGDEGPELLVGVGVDGVGRTEELLVRPLGPLVAGLGPFAGAIVRGDGSLRLAIDAWAVATRARALGATGSSAS
jgi:two-component system chemotaxis sensor kinase CheA